MVAEAKDCPKCGLVTPPTAQRCDCGWDFVSRRQEPFYPREKKEYVPVPRWKQRLAGCVIVTIGGGWTVWTWYTALSKGYFYEKVSILMPTFSVFGLALIAMPGYREERIGRGEDISELSGLRLITPRWWVVLVVSLIAGYGNFLLLKYG